MLHFFKKDFIYSFADADLDSQDTHVTCDEWIWLGGTGRAAPVALPTHRQQSAFFALV